MTDAPEMPSSVRIGAITYRVTADREEWVAQAYDSGFHGYGKTVHRSATIFLSPECTPAVNRLTLWHEVLHCVDEVLMGDPDWRNLGGAPQSKVDAEEVVVRMWEHPTLDVLRDNPDLVAYLTAA